MSCRYTAALALLVAAGAARADDRGATCDVSKATAERPCSLREALNFPDLAATDRRVVARMGDLPATDHNVEALSTVIGIRKQMADVGRHYFEQMCSIWTRMDGEIVASQRTRGVPAVGLTSPMVFLATGRPDSDEITPLKDGSPLRVWAWLAELRLTPPVGASISFEHREPGTWSFVGCEWCDGTMCTPVPWLP